MKKKKCNRYFKNLPIIRLVRRNIKFSKLYEPNLVNILSKLKIQHILHKV